MSAFAGSLTDRITRPATTLTVARVRRNVAGIGALWEPTICGTPHIPLSQSRPLIARWI